MSTIFFDTCAIRYLVKQGLDGEQVRNVLSQRVDRQLLAEILYLKLQNYQKKILLSLKTCDF